MSELSFDKAVLLEKYHNPDFAMAYGSGIFQQEGYDEQDPRMIDFVFAPENTREWHQQNLKTNPDDYSWITKITEKLGVEFVEWLQNSGAKINYHPYIPFEGREIKYGVISQVDLLDDLRHWTTLYVAGRLHKPVEILSTTPEFEETMRINLESALKVALLLLPENFTEQELYEAIAGISYTGDSRMKHGENPNKVPNIVRAQMDGFRSLYSGVLHENSRNVTVLSDEKMQQDVRADAQRRLIKALPSHLQAVLRDILNKGDLRDATPDQVRQTISKATAMIVHDSSIAQTVKGPLTAGPKRAWRYLQDKRGKREEAAERG